MKKLFFIFSLILLFSCSKSVYKTKWTTAKAPDTFVTRFETSKGTFDIQINRVSSQKAVDRFYQLVKNHYFDTTIFYRVVPDFVAQFGISDSTKTAQWKKSKIPDEEVRQSNIKGALSFARGGKETRHDHLFINLTDNPRLDTLNYQGVKGFPAFGNVINGMEVVEKLYSGYGNETMSKVNPLNYAQLLKKFPKLDQISKIYILNIK
ncbi:peptidylprolyl isomerase [Flavobacterium sp.]|uniref:peptidylprolyl isomerase n=1 Tax=Flavobacterium sp. TaxID=239 RepID=UPI00286CE709|nr:peptidylprolyl isomerase [Flavobacterium sp.]